MFLFFVFSLVRYLFADGLDCGHFVVLTSKEDW